MKRSETQGFLTMLSARTSGREGSVQAQVSRPEIRS